MPVPDVFPVLIENSLSARTESPCGYVAFISLYNTVRERGIPGKTGKKNGAEDEIRTRDLLLGKEMLYH